MACLILARERGHSKFRTPKDKEHEERIQDKIGHKVIHELHSPPEDENGRFPFKPPPMFDGVFRVMPAWIAGIQARRMRPGHPCQPGFRRSMPERRAGIVVFNSDGKIPSTPNQIFKGGHKELTQRTQRARSAQDQIYALRLYSGYAATKLGLISRKDAKAQRK